MNIDDYSETGLSSEVVFEATYYDQPGQLEKAKIWHRADDSYYVEAWGGYDGFIKRDFGTKAEAREYITELEEHNK